MLHPHLGLPVLRRRRPSLGSTIAEAAAARARLADAIINTAKRDHFAFTTVYKLTAAKLFDVCVRVCGDRQTAEDILQEVYILVWRNAHAYQRNEASPISWLAKIAQNRSLDWLRNNLAPPTVELHYASKTISDAPLAFQALISEQDTAKIDLSFKMLDPQFREILHAAFFKGLVYVDLAKYYGVPEGTMKSWIRRSLFQTKNRATDRLGGFEIDIPAIAKRLEWADM